MVKILCRLVKVYSTRKKNTAVAEMAKFTAGRVVIDGLSNKNNNTS